MMSACLIEPGGKRTVHRPPSGDEATGTARPGFLGRLVLWQKIILGLIAGIIVGILIKFRFALGATVNMDGTALYQGVAALFVAQAYGIDLNNGNYVTIILTSTLASIGSAGVPGPGLIMLTRVLTSAGLPLEGIALIAGVDRILCMARTTVNITGDAMVAVLIGKSEGEIDLEIYNSNARPVALNRGCCGSDCCGSGFSRDSFAL